MGQANSICALDWASKLLSWGLDETAAVRTKTVYVIAILADNWFPFWLEVIGSNIRRNYILVVALFKLLRISKVEMVYELWRKQIVSKLTHFVF